MVLGIWGEGEELIIWGESFFWGLGYMDGGWVVGGDDMGEKGVRVGKMREEGILVVGMRLVIWRGKIDRG